MEVKLFREIIFSACKKYNDDSSYNIKKGKEIYKDIKNLLNAILVLETDPNNIDKYFKDRTILSPKKEFKLKNTIPVIRYRSIRSIKFKRLLYLKSIEFLKELNVYTNDIESMVFMYRLVSNIFISYYNNPNMLYSNILGLMYISANNYREIRCIDITKLMIDELKMYNINDSNIINNRLMQISYIISCCNTNISKISPIGCNIIGKHIKSIKSIGREINRSNLNPFIKLWISICPIPNMKYNINNINYKLGIISLVLLDAIMNSNKYSSIIRSFYNT